ncbi:hypothetical protein DFJ43DRAFT_194894 [Lentinula guzmanii]|uniref:LysM domain-containing protein n=1 Tax=Lentinula guzmanii TaxID=2804957 RepID=A0AA38JFE4_9AGAR|nr:hypothetical protein DFJ43DRAFT_194894 [Lentinula guzmanii]
MFARFSLFAIVTALGAIGFSWAQTDPACSSSNGNIVIKVPTTSTSFPTGVTCQEIATAFKISLLELESANAGVDCQNLAAGSVLCVPGTTCSQYKVQAGDTCALIVTKNGIRSLAALQLSNPQIDDSCNNLTVGENVCVPKPASSA